MKSLKAHYTEQETLQTKSMITEHLVTKESKTVHLWP